MATERDNGESQVIAFAHKSMWPVVIFILMLVVWEAWVRVFNVPEGILPAPWRITTQIGEHWALLLTHTWPTTLECLLGFFFAVVGGMGLGILLAFFPMFHTSVYPLIVAFQVVPKVALAPLFMAWFGLGIETRVVLAFVIAFFPMVVNTYAGILSADPLMVRMAHSFNASRWTVFSKVEFPHALPYIFSGLKIGITFAVIGIIVAEFITAQRGLGYIIIFAEGNFDVPMMMAAIILLSIVGVVLYAGVVLAEKLVITWEHGQKLV
jgi:NitT/TauT family transport system permease protein